MSYNGSGTFVVNSSGQPVVTGTVISSTAFNALTADLATGLSTAITKDGQTTTTSRILFAQGVSSTLVTDATSATTGSIITAGGISTQKALWVGTTSRLVGNTQHDGLVGIGMTPSNILDITQTQNADSIVKLLNSSSGAAATGTLQLSNNIGASAIYRMHGGSFTTSGIYRQDGALLWANGAGGMTVGTGAAQPLYFVINNGAAGQFNASGHLCINTTTDQGHLNVGGALTSFSGGTANTASCISMDFSGGVGRIQGYGPDASTNGSLSFSSCRSNGSNPQAMTLTAGGKLDINTTTAGDGRLNVLSNQASEDTMHLSDSGANASGRFISFLKNSFATEIGSITDSGGTGVSYNTTSDYRLKDNVQPMTGGLATVAALKPVTYDWISNGSAGEGFIAHELQAVIPNAVSGEKDAVKEDGSIKPQGVDFSKIVPHLVAAVQELTARLTALETK
jgi:hypothetical protein